VTGAPDGKLYRVRTGGHVRAIADLTQFEADVNPDGGEIDSNPFKVAALGGRKVLVADAAANALLIVDRNGEIDWVATLPDRLVPTGNAKDIVGCPDPDPEFADICDLPGRIPAQAVATSVAVGPDGAYYVGELKGFPAPLGRSRVWRIEPGTRHAECGSSPACRVVLKGFTSIVDLSFRNTGALLVTEFDEASWFAAELGQETVGTIDSCRLGSGNCKELGQFPLPSAAVGIGGRVFATTMSLVPGQADVIEVTAP
jgi:hypothetical protein